MRKAEISIQHTLYTVLIEVASVEYEGMKYSDGIIFSAGDSLYSTLYTYTHVLAVILRVNSARIYSNHLISYENTYILDKCMMARYE